MSTPSSSPFRSSQLTPKRKRESEVPITPPDEMRFNTHIPGAILITAPSDDSRSGSPRTKVAYNFQGLRLEDGGAVSKLDLRPENAPKMTARDEGALQETAVRKRVRVLGGTTNERLSQRKEVPETPGGLERGSFNIVIGPERRVSPTLEEKARKVVLHNEVDPIIFKGSPAEKLKRERLARSYPSINRLSESKSRTPKKRMGSPPLFDSAEAFLEMQNGAGRQVEDPARSALTWHHDEITGHNTSDPEDDGEGINGIGFRPTAAMAYARTEKRKAQMADYRNREARDARAKRSERRRGSDGSKGSSKEEQEAARRVRFMDAEVRSVISID